MRKELVKPLQFFELRSGDVIRVKSVESDLVHCDRFDCDARRWIKVKDPLPTWTVYAPCDDPTTNDENIGTIRRWWNARRRRGDEF